MKIPPPLGRLTPAPADSVTGTRPAGAPGPAGAEAKSGGSEEWPPVRQRLTMVGRLCLQVSFHAGWTIHGGMPNVGDSTREALAISWVPEQTTMLPAFDVVGKYLLRAISMSTYPHSF